MITAPGAYDGITARLIEQAGFPAVYMTGAGTSMARGFPDFGLLSMSEMVENAAMIARTVEIPVIADADTGYGNELNVTRTVREFEGRGVAGFEALSDELADFIVANFFGFDLFPNLDRGVGRIAGAERRVEFFERRARVIDQLHLHYRLIIHRDRSTPHHPPDR